MAYDKNQPPSPCIGVCAVSGRTGFCLGCGRSMREIGEWSRLSAAEKRAVLKKLPARLQDANQSS